MTFDGPPPTIRRIRDAVAIQQEAVFGPNQIGSGSLTFYAVYDDRNSTDPTRWRTKQIHVSNTTDYAFECFVQDPVTLEMFSAFSQPHADQSWDVPVQYQNRSPEEFSWGRRLA